MAVPATLASTTTQVNLALGSGTYVYTGNAATLVNSGAGAGPSAVTNLQVVQQAGTSNTSHDTQKLAWGAATPQAGTTIASYKIYRNGSAYDTTTSLNYTDTVATNSSECTSYITTTTYKYAVSAIDSAAAEGPQATPNIYLQYQGNFFTTGNPPGSGNANPDFSYGLTVTWGSTAQAKSPATKSVQVTTATGGGFQPYTDGTVCPGYVMGCSPFTYYTFDMYAPSQLTDFSIALHSRPGGTSNPADVYSMFITPVISGGVAQGFGAFTPNTWCTYKVPIQPLGIGAGTFVGTVTGGNLTVTSVSSGTGPDAGCYVTGGTLPTGTYISSANGNTHAVGSTFPLTNGNGTTIPNQGSTTFGSQRFTLYKPDMHIGAPSSGTINVYFDNFGFSTV